MVGRYVLCDTVVGGGQDGGQFSDQMWSVARLFQLLNHRNHNIVVDALSVNLGNELHIARRGGRRIFGGSTTTLWFYLEAGQSR